MRILAVLAALATAALVVLFLRQTDGGREAADRPGQEVGDELAARADRVVASESRRESRNDTTETEAHRLRIVYADGSPAADLLVQRAVGRPLRTKIYRNGDYPEKVIWLVTRHDTAVTGEDGSLRFPLSGGPPGTQAVLFTGSDSPAFLLETLDPGRSEYRAQRKVKVLGVLKDRRGLPIGSYWIEGRRGQPEDWDTRYRKEDDSFVTADYDLEVDPHARSGMTLGGDGRFELDLLPGRSMLLLGENREDGVLPIDVPPGGIDLGEVSLPPKAPGSRVKRSVHGVVLSCAGAPLRAEVRIWDGTVGEPSHVSTSQEDGRFEFGGLTSDRVIVWAVSTWRPHLVIPSQCSGTVLLPCNTPIVLRSPAQSEYWWARPAAIDGFFLFIRDGVFVGGSRLDPVDVVGIPPGDYRVILVRDREILETGFSITRGGKGQLHRHQFREMGLP